MTIKEKIKKAIICKNVKTYSINRLINKTYVPKSGDVAIFRVLELGKHIAIQGYHGKNTYLFPGDYIMATFANRYASGQFEGYVPDKYYLQYQILGMGGAVGVLASMHYKFEKIGATQLKLVGYATDENKEVINTHYLGNKKVNFSPRKRRKSKIILSIGSSMDSGKTTSAAYLCRGLANSGHQVGFIKLTGTVFSKDKHFVHDCGAHQVVDFSTLGFPSTYMYSEQDLLDLYEGLLKKLAPGKPDYIVVEIADGILQRETDMLLKNKMFMKTVHNVMLSCGDSLSVLSSLDYLKKRGFQPFAISGLVNTSPLMVQEVRDSVSVPVLDLENLASKKVVKYVERVKKRRQKTQEMNLRVIARKAAG
jgi:dethiobiotin synthetase